MSVIETCVSAHRPCGYHSPSDVAVANVDTRSKRQHRTTPPARILTGSQAAPPPPPPPLPPSKRHGTSVRVHVRSRLPASATPRSAIEGKKNYCLSKPVQRQAGVGDGRAPGRQAFRPPIPLRGFRRRTMAGGGSCIGPRLWGGSCPALGARGAQTRSLRVFRDPKIGHIARARARGASYLKEGGIFGDGGHGGRSASGCG
jgi:hypothetical protein